MITTKVMHLESTRMERASHLLCLPYYYRSFLNKTSISSHLLIVIFFVSITEKREDPKTQNNSVDSNGIFSLTATCHSKPNKSNDSNVSKTNSMVKFIATSDATKCHSILSIKLINERTNEDGGTYQCRTSGKGKSKLASLHAKEGKFLKL